MKKISLKKIAVFCAMLLIAGFSAPDLVGQTVYQTQVMDIRLQGTSNLHDWEMKAIKGQSEASFTVDSKNKITSLTSDFYMNASFLLERLLLNGVARSPEPGRKPIHRWPTRVTSRCL